MLNKLLHACIDAGCMILGFCAAAGVFQMIDYTVRHFSYKDVLWPVVLVAIIYFLKYRGK